MLHSRPNHWIQTIRSQGLCVMYQTQIKSKSQCFDETQTFPLKRMNVKLFAIIICATIQNISFSRIFFQFKFQNKDQQTKSLVGQFFGVFKHTTECTCTLYSWETSCFSFITNVWIVVSTLSGNYLFLYILLHTHFLICFVLFKLCNSIESCKLHYGLNIHTEKLMKMTVITCGREMKREKLEKIASTCSVEKKRVKDEYYVKCMVSHPFHRFIRQSFVKYVKHGLQLIVQ